MQDHYKEHLTNIIQEATELLLIEKRIPLLIITDKVVEAFPQAIQTNGDLYILAVSKISIQERIRLLESVLSVEKATLAELN